ncbi:PREDICTED: galanin receptor type 3 [Mandrillus leucophaeus]|uniref:galanin receptor type 3 n=1 Tax=Mandrillus leucophaeus TaxID=9568 RepID=UPI0005F3901C|nr:PREDICTED: galanin receptor type 3 [Mandrillus leucophaeus]
MADAQNISLDSPGSVGAVAVPVVFALIFLLGTVGNGLVLAVLLQPGPSAWQEPGSTTDLFILNLAVADLCFILCCVPFQATIYTLDAWLFGALVCKAVHLLIYLTMYASSFTLAAVSVDRVHFAAKCICGYGPSSWASKASCCPLGTGTRKHCDQVHILVLKTFPVPGNALLVRDQGIHSGAVFGYNGNPGPREWAGLPGGDHSNMAGTKDWCSCGGLRGAADRTENLKVNFGASLQY